MSAAKHFYLTFNPYLNTDHEHEYTQAHEFYDQLKGHKLKKKTATMHWGKMIGADRTSTLDTSAFQAIVDENQELNCSTHLYITDFQNLWVAKIDGIKDKITKKDKTLPFYEGKNVEVWFEISDMTLLEHNHEETANKLAELYIDNEHNEITINGLSPFTTGIKYPVILQDVAEEQFFDEFDSDEYSHLIMQPNNAVNSNSLAHVLRCIHTYAFSEMFYAKLPHAAKAEIESAELDMLEQRHHNMGRVAFGYLKALEVIMNDLVIHHLKRSGFGEDFFVDNTSSPPKLYLQQSKSHFVPIKQFQKNFSLNQIIYFVERCVTSNHISFKKAFADHKPFIRFVKGDLQKIIQDNQLINIRGILAHNNSDAVSFKDAMAVRNLILGVGCKGLVQMLYQGFYPDQLGTTIKVLGDYDNKSGNKDYSAGTKLKLVG